ncbi:MAG: hypothetical protein Q8O15_07970 [Rectinemataceae bacterium]|nr:hypothetical protein [Rectinemataceae bacterium]
MPELIDMREFELVASQSGVFKGVEIDLLHETLLSWKGSPGEPYTVLELRDGKILVAFAIISKINGRQSTFDIRYIVVDRDYHSTECGSHLLQLLDEDLLAKNSYAVIRLETSGKKLENLRPEAFQESGYKMIGHIPGYYGEGDDYFYLIKTVYRNTPAFSESNSPNAPDSSDAEIQ